MKELEEKKNDGGPAFPGIGDGPYVGSFVPMGGMSLRDWFAGKALFGISARSGQSIPDVEGMAEECFRRADAMLKEREK